MQVQWPSRRGELDDVREQTAAGLRRVVDGVGGYPAHFLTSLGRIGRMNLKDGMATRNVTAARVTFGAAIASLTA